MYFRILLYIFLINLIIPANLVSQEMTVKGIYQGKNLDVQNPFGPNGIGFCVTKVTVNEEETGDAIKSNAFEIELDRYNFNFGDSIRITFTHIKGCKPTILNLYNIRPRSTFEIVSINYNPQTKQLRWTTRGEISSLPFIVERYRWRKWSKVTEIQGKGHTEKNNSYSAKIETHSGKNKFRIKQTDYSKKSRYSPEVIYRSLQAKVIFSPLKPKKKITFSYTTDYEIYNYYGQLILKGRGKTVDVSKFEKAEYFLNYDNTATSFNKK